MLNEKSLGICEKTSIDIHMVENELNKVVENISLSDVIIVFNNLKEEIWSRNKDGNLEYTQLLHLTTMEMHGGNKAKSLKNSME